MGKAQLTRPQATRRVLVVILKRKYSTLCYTRNVITKLMSITRFFNLHQNYEFPGLSSFQTSLPVGTAAGTILHLNLTRPHSSHASHARYKEYFELSHSVSPGPGPCSSVTTLHCFTPLTIPALHTFFSLHPCTTLRHLQFCAIVHSYATLDCMIAVSFQFTLLDDFWSELTISFAPNFFWNSEVYCFFDFNLILVTSHHAGYDRLFSTSSTSDKKVPLSKTCQCHSLCHICGLIQETHSITQFTLYRSISYASI